jgi:aminobenzoyl-glutamate transport protein
MCVAETVGFVPRATTGREALKAQSAPADPAILFVIALAIVWIASALLAPLQFTEIDPRNGMPVHVANQLTGTALANFLANMVTEFVTFPA